jgi:hypothetical protein
MDFAEIGQCKPVLLGLSLAGNLVKPLLSLYGTEWRERGYGLWRGNYRVHGLRYYRTQRSKLRAVTLIGMERGRDSCSVP